MNESKKQYVVVTDAPPWGERPFVYGPFPSQAQALVFLREKSARAKRYTYFVRVLRAAT